MREIRKSDYERSEQLYIFIEPMEIRGIKGYFE